MFPTMQLRAFVAIFETGTVTEAARRLGRTQPQVSRLVAELEQASGLVLFLREKRRLVPTEEGAAFYDEVVRILHGLDDLTRLAAALSRGRPEHLRILAMPNLALSIVPESLSRLRKRFPAAVASIETASRNQLGAIVGFRPFDIAIAILPIDLPNMAVTTLGSVRTFALVPKHLPLANESQITMKQLASTPFVATSRNTVLRLKLDEFCTREKLSLQVVSEAPNVMTAARMAEAGVGVTIADELTASSVDEKLVAVRSWKPGWSSKIGLIVPKGSRVSRVAAAFVEECHATFEAYAARGRKQRLDTRFSRV